MPCLAAGSGRRGGAIRCAIGQCGEGRAEGQRRAIGTARAAVAFGQRGLLAIGIVMPGLVPGIYVLLYPSKKDVDGRDKPGHDGKMPGAFSMGFSEVPP